MSGQRKVGGRGAGGEQGRPGEGETVAASVLKGFPLVLIPDPCRSGNILYSALGVHWISAFLQ